jgi:hypothetical protein
MSAFLREDLMLKKPEFAYPHVQVETDINLEEKLKYELGEIIISMIRERASGGYAAYSLPELKTIARLLFNQKATKQKKELVEWLLHPDRLEVIKENNRLYLLKHPEIISGN